MYNLQRGPVSEVAVVVLAIVIVVVVAVVVVVEVLFLFAFVFVVVVVVAVAVVVVVVVVVVGVVAVVVAVVLVVILLVVAVSVIVLCFLAFYYSSFVAISTLPFSSFLLISVLHVRSGISSHTCTPPCFQSIYKVCVRLSFDLGYSALFPFAAVACLFVCFWTLPFAAALLQFVPPFSCLPFFRFLCRVGVGGVQLLFRSNASYSSAMPPYVF